MSESISILVVEDSPIVCKIIRHVIRDYPQVDATFAASLKEAKEAIEQSEAPFFAALVDLNLPDAPNGEVVDLMLEKSIPSVVLTASFDDQRREALFAKGVVDYVTKEGKFSYQYAINLIVRLFKNRDLKILVVDDSETQRRFIAALLQQHCYQVVTAADGVEAIRAIVANQDIRLMIVDYNMPRMDGFELVQKIRHKYEKSDMIIIGLSAEGQSGLSAKFIKNGANDFLRKPFNHEEFYCRIMHNVEILDMVEQIRDSARRDYLTGCYNRRYFFEQAEPLFERCTKSDTALPVAVLDIDHFKRINDTYGHDAGDTVLCHFTGLMEDALERFVFARAGGEEFFILLPGLDMDRAYSVVERLREIVESSPLEYSGETIHYTFSAGISAKVTATLDERIHFADENLYRAKESGRNLVLGDDIEEI